MAAAALLLAAAATGSAAAGPALPGRPCSRFAVDRSRCLRVVVPLDRSGALPGTISLLVRIEPPPEGPPAGAILALAGGPGQAADPLLARFAGVLPASVERTHELVTFDQRGTGSSGRLSCPPPRGRSISGPAPLDALDPQQPLLDEVAACAAHLGPARAHYTTADSVADVEAVRAALGIDKLTLWGTSYGTKVALDYAAAYPQHVERLLLDSVVPPSGVDPFERITIGSMPRVMRLICAGRCHGFTADPAADLDALAQQLAQAPMRGPWVDELGTSIPLRIAAPRLFALLLAGDFSPQLRALLPAAIHAARSGDPALLLRLATLSGAQFGATGGDSDALLLATRCEDGGVPWAPGTPIPQRATAISTALAAIPPAQLAPFGAAAVRALGDADVCRAWPESPISQPRLPLPDVPTLILSGALDLRTPRANALALAAQIPGSRVVNVPQTGHSALSSDESECASAAVAAFFAGAAPRACRPEPLFLFESPAPPPPRSLRALRPLPGVPPRAGRALTAVVQTVVWLGRMTTLELPLSVGSFNGKIGLIRMGGLRGGSLAISDRSFALHGYSVVPGVTLSTTIRVSGDERRSPPVRLWIGGPAGARGWVLIGDRWTTGRVDGKRIRLRTRRLDAATAQAGAAAAGPGLPARRPLLQLPAAVRALLRVPAGG